MSANQPPAAPSIKADITVPSAMMDGRENETLRSPPHMGRGEIVRRLAELSEFDPAGAGGYFKGVERLSSARIGARVVAALNWLQENPAHPFVSEQLQLVALNLKNLD